MPFDAPLLDTSLTCRARNCGVAITHYSRLLVLCTHMLVSRS